MDGVFTDRIGDKSTDRMEVKKPTADRWFLPTGGTGKAKAIMAG